MSVSLWLSAPARHSFCTFHSSWDGVGVIKLNIRMLGTIYRLSKSAELCSTQRLTDSTCLRWQIWEVGTVLWEFIREGPVSFVPIRPLSPPHPQALPSSAHMTTPEDDRSPGRRCTCTSEVEGTNVDIQENRIASMAVPDHNSSIGTWANPLSPGLF